MSDSGSPAVIPPPPIRKIKRRRNSAALIFPFPANPPREIGGIAAEWRDGGLRSAC